MKIIDNNNNESYIVGWIAQRTAIEYGVSPSVAKQIRIAATLHDVGKHKLPDKILNKPGRLNEREFGIIKSHTILGAEILSGFHGGFKEMAKKIALFHHERYDGGGYWGIRTEELPYYVPIVAISDVFTALVSKRPYKHAWPTDEAIEYINNKAGTQFCPDLTKMFIALIGRNGLKQALGR